MYIYIYLISNREVCGDRVTTLTVVVVVLVVLKDMSIVYGFMIVIQSLTFFTASPA